MKKKSKRNLWPIQYQLADSMEIKGKEEVIRRKEVIRWNEALRRKEEVLNENEEVYKIH